jgi:hypothetical protein
MEEKQVRNLRKNQLKKAIFLTEDEFVDIFGRKYDVHFSDGFVQVFEETGESVDFIPVLSEHFGVEVTSVHTDGCDILGVWIIYKEKESFIEVKEITSEIVRLNVVDDHPETEAERIMETFYLVNPDRSKIELLQKKMSARFDENDEFYDEKFDSYFGAVYDFIRENFEEIKIIKEEVQW